MQIYRYVYTCIAPFIVSHWKISISRDEQALWMSSQVLTVWLPREEHATLES